MITLTQKPNSLLISLNPGDDNKADLAAYNESFNDETVLSNLLEDSGYLGNGWRLLSPEDIGALTDAPIISYGEAIYWFPNYQVESPIETLLGKGQVEFEKAETIGNKEVVTVDLQTQLQDTLLSNRL